ncbi:hypothetical protein CLV63_1418 [Murinocardiopsis flavida]|uniref:Uncharacterized protein n=1 Tax=Murinocardiopsis flavida TaxID=645275 RepID=A0A2P8CDP1_9ACTN|nr:hypothetical protein [Murinocardiopsis flavida]PSK83042.1 hypothetical protein CLV63_1418 [Murinocardiopsis flavida]
MSDWSIEINLTEDGNQDIAEAIESAVADSTVLRTIRVTRDDGTTVTFVPMPVR